MSDEGRTTEEEIYEEDHGPEELQKFLTQLREKYGTVPTGKLTKKENKKLQEQLEEEFEEAPEELPEQGNLVDKFVDVEDKDGKRLGTGRCLREDFGPPWQNRVKMISPPYWDGKIVENVRIRLSPTQQIKD